MTPSTKKHKKKDKTVRPGKSRSRRPLKGDAALDEREYRRRLKRRERHMRQGMHVERQRQDASSPREAAMLIMTGWLYFLTRNKLSAIVTIVMTILALLGWAVGFYLYFFTNTVSIERLPL